MTDAMASITSALSDRYTIEREIGRGGMATVYLAEDLKHHRKVAVKVLRPELAQALGADRFHQEIEIAAQLTHPHILPLHDSGEAEGFLFYVMPYIEGESLRDKLAKEGELPITEAVRILRDVVEALKHAHKNNVVHRDIKPDNVMLAEDHALVTDFGVAKAVSDATGAIGLTTEGVALGTPAYMAPEQAVADPHIDHRADIYAVGVIAYELLTGRTPFVGTTQQELLAAHVTQTPDPVTKYRESVRPVLAELVMKCLEKKAADRWQTAEELLPQLEALATPSGGVTPTGMVPVGAARRGWKLAGATGVIVAIISATVVVVMYRGGTGGRLDPNRVAVMPFENLTGVDSLDVHGRVAASWIADGLQQVEVLSVVPWMVVQQGVIGSSQVNPVSELAEMTGAGIVVSGNYSRFGDSLRFSAEVTDAHTMEVQHTVSRVSSLAANPDEAFGDICDRLAGAVAAMLHADFGDLLSMALRRPTFSAHQEYVKGIDRFSQSRYEQAIEHFTAARAFDSAFAWPVIVAAIANRNLHRHERADSFLAILDSSPGLLSETDQRVVDWVNAMQEGHLLLAAEITSELARETPNFLYQAAETAINVNRLHAAVDALERLDEARGWTRGWSPYWSQRTLVWHMLGDHTRELEEARRARREIPNSRNTLLYEVRALAALGRVDETTALFDEVLALRPDPGWGYAREVALGGLHFRAHGFFDAAEDAFILALERLRAHSPEDESRTSHRFHLAETLYWSEQLDQSKRLFQQLVSEHPDSVEYMGYLGAISARLGDTEAASSISDQLAAISRPYLWGSNTAWRARIASLLGDSERAVELLRVACSEGLQYGIWIHRDVDLEPLRDYPPFQELLRPKG